MDCLPPSFVVYWCAMRTTVSEGSEQAMETQVLPQTAFKYDVQVMEEGRVELYVPIPAGAYVTVVVIPESTDTFGDLLVAAESSLGFWDNPYDDEDWNNA